MTGLEKIINRIQEEADAAAAGKPEPGDRCGGRGGGADEPATGHVVLGTRHVLALFVHRTLLSRLATSMRCGRIWCRDTKSGDALSATLRVSLYCARALMVLLYHHGARGVAQAG